jgi:hypothetical protein
MCKAIIEREIIKVIMVNTHNRLEYEIMEYNYGNYVSIHECGVFGELLGINYSIDYHSKEVKLSIKHNGKTIKPYPNVECDSCGIVTLGFHEGDKFYGFMKAVSLIIDDIMVDL